MGVKIKSGLNKKNWGKNKKQVEKKIWVKKNGKKCG